MNILVMYQIMGGIALAAWMEAVAQVCLDPWDWL